GGDREQGPAPVRERGQRGPGRVRAASGAAAGDEDRPAGCAQPLRQGVYLVGGRYRDPRQRGGHRRGYLAARRLARLHVQRQAEDHRGARGRRAVRLGHVLVHLRGAYPPEVGADRGRDPGQVEEEVGARRGRLRRHHHQRGAALGGLGDAGQGVRHARPLVHRHHAHLARDPRVRVGHGGGPGLVRAAHEPGAGGDQRVGEVEVTRTHQTKGGPHPAGGQGAPDRLRDQHQRSTSARTGVGLPEPPTIGSGAAITTAPVGGSLARLRSWVRPYLSLPSSMAWHGNGGSNECAAPASVPTVSTPIPITGASSASHFAHATETPGVCPSLANAAGSSPRASQPVRSSNQPPVGSAPCSFSQARMCSTSNRKSGSATTCSVTSSTAAGATSRRAGTWDTSAPERPVIQWIGASKWVPVCSPVVKLFQYQAGPRSSYRLISRRRNGSVWPNCSGRARIGVRSVKGAVRSTTSTVPLAIASTRSERSAIPRP